MRKNIKKLVKLFTIGIIVSSFITINVTSAYQLIGKSWYYTMQKNICVSMPSAYDQYKDDIKTWENKTGRVAFIWNGNGTNKMHIFNNTGVDNGTYAVTYRNSNNFKTIVTYKTFSQTTQARRNETIVHEVGHTLGLDHIPSIQNQSTSVMRATGFNNKAYPLTDDINGIKAIYK